MNGMTKMTYDSPGFEPRKDSNSDGDATNDPDFVDQLKISFDEVGKQSSQ